MPGTPHAICRRTQRGGGSDGGYANIPRILAVWHAVQSTSPFLSAQNMYAPLARRALRVGRSSRERYNSLMLNDDGLWLA